MASGSRSPITRVGVVAKARLQAATPHLVEIERWLGARGVDVVFETATAALMPQGKRHVADKRPLVEQVGMVLILGGDGTLLSMADCIGHAGLPIPILGVNFGSLGFLTEVTLPELYSALEAAISGLAPTEPRLMLRSRTERPSAPPRTEIALNDVVITKAARSRLIDLSVSVGEEFVTAVRGDGLIVATPTGSTAYNLATGGPIVQPNVDAIILTPIAPHTLTNRPIVIPGSSTVRVRPMMGERDEVSVTFDGQASFELRPGDEVHVSRAEQALLLIRPGTRSYFQVLHEKLKWSGR